MYFIGEEELEALKKVFHERKKLYRYSADNSGECDQFEREYAAHLGVNHALLLSSGTNSLFLALLAGGIQPGDEVLIPSYTFVATAAAVLQAGAIPIIVNIDSELSLDIADAARKISPKTRAMILVHMDGLCADVERCVDFCEKRNLLLVEDVAQALGANFKGRKLGSLGDFGCFSLNENKTISCGEGGILVTNDRASYEKAFCLHDAPAQFNPTKKDFFKEILPFMGFSMRVSEIQGAIMRVQLKRLEFILAELRKRKKILTEAVPLGGPFRVIKGYDRAGECGSSLHLLFDSLEDLQHYGRKSRELGFMFAPVVLRPAHVSWKWSHLFGDRAHIQPANNPYSREETAYKYPMADSLPSAEILTRVLKMDIDIHLSADQTMERAELLKGFLSQGK